MAFRRRSSADRLFARFCRTGDPAALGRVFDRTAPELGKVAAWLGGDPHRAEDLLQRTFLVAIESRASWDPERPVMPWLVGILTNQARNLRRAERERHGPAAGARGLPAPDPSNEAAARELEAAVSEARAALHDPYRQVLELHLDHGLGAAEIAEVLRRPPGTVRTQIARGLEMVRERLPRGFVAGTVAVLTAAQLRAVREAVLGHVAPAAAMTGAATGAAVLTGGWLVMQKKALLAAGVAVGLLALSVPVALGAFGKGGGLDAAGAVPLVAPVEMPDRGDGDGMIAQPGTSEPARRVAAATPHPVTHDPTTATVEVRLRWKHDGGPAANVAVHVVSWDGPNPHMHERRAVTDEDGHCVLERVRSGKCTVYCGIGGSRSVQVADGARELVELEVERQGIARGVVLDPEGNPLAGAGVWLSDNMNWSEGTEICLTNGKGHFEVALGSNHHIGARKAGFAPSFLRALHPDGATLEIELVPSPTAVATSRPAPAMPGPERLDATGSKAFRQDPSS